MTHTSRTWVCPCVFSCSSRCPHWSSLCWRATSSDLRPTTPTCNSPRTRRMSRWMKCMRTPVVLIRHQSIVHIHSHLKVLCSTPESKPGTLILGKQTVNQIARLHSQKKIHMRKALIIDQFQWSMQLKYVCCGAECSFLKQPLAFLN